MSALHPIADMCGAKRNVRFVPIADSWTAQASRGRKCISVPTLLVLTCRRRSRSQRQRQTLVTWLSRIAQRFPKSKVGDSVLPGLPINPFSVRRKSRGIECARIATNPRCRQSHPPEWGRMLQSCHRSVGGLRPVDQLTVLSIIGPIEQPRTIAAGDEKAC